MAVRDKELSHFVVVYRQGIIEEEENIEQTDL